MRILNFPIKCYEKNECNTLYEFKAIEVLSSTGIGLVIGACVGGGAGASAGLILGATSGLVGTEPAALTSLILEGLSTANSPYSYYNYGSHNMDLFFAPLLGAIAGTDIFAYSFALGGAAVGSYMDTHNSNSNYKYGHAAIATVLGFAASMIYDHWDVLQENLGFSHADHHG